MVCFAGLDVSVVESRGSPSLIRGGLLNELEMGTWV